MATVILVKTLAHTAGVDASLNASGETVGEVLAALCAEHPELGKHLVHANGKPKGHVLLSVGGERVSADDKIGADDELRVLLATAGGVCC
ncbi:MoaD/ThiS family protein [Streptomyces sp. YGL11-2]|uniref:MoaD/ThiS family protein n=1 Tax=Streptomyces sp. YGL11-2 TaxID=3414028 RepID=UPI003CF6FBC2